MVIATQNPIEHEGTYPLPEAQLDRFMLRLSIGYPTAEVEAEILSSHSSGTPLTDIGPVNDAPGVAEMILQAQRVHVAPAIRRYIVDLVRRHPPALRHVPRSEPARLDHDPARVEGDGCRRRARLRDPRRREGARRPGARPPDHRDGGRRHERPFSPRSSWRRSSRRFRSRSRRTPDAIRPRGGRPPDRPRDVARRAHHRLSRTRGRRARPGGVAGHRRALRPLGSPEDRRASATVGHPRRPRNPRHGADRCREPISRRHVVPAARRPAPVRARPPGQARRLGHPRPRHPAGHLHGPAADARSLSAGTARRSTSPTRSPWSVSGWSSTNART